MERRSSDCGLFVRQNLFCHFAPSEYTSSIIVYSSNLMNEFDPYFDRASTANRIPPQQAEEQPAATAPWRKLLQETVQVVLPALALALVVHLFLAQATIVYGQSMEPNLLERQRLIIDKISFRLHPPQRNDIVVLNLPGMEEMLVKRIIALPGETVEIHQGTVYIDGDPLPEPYPHGTGLSNMPPVTLGPLSYFVLGDNRDNSNDSRSFGPVKREHILGRVWLRYWPFDQLTQF
jgi:signal peptidase I